MRFGVDLKWFDVFPRSDVVVDTSYSDLLYKIIFSKDTVFYFF